MTNSPFNLNLLNQPELLRAKVLFEVEEPGVSSTLSKFILQSVTDAHTPYSPGAGAEGIFSARLFFRPEEILGASKPGARSTWKSVAATTMSVPGISIGIPPSSLVSPAGWGTKTCSKSFILAKGDCYY
jgi:hypothetical protein